MATVVDKKQKPSKKRRSQKKERDEQEMVKPRKKFTKSDRQVAENEIEEGYDKWCYGEFEEEF